MTPKASMTDIIVHRNAKVSPLLPLLLRAFCAWVWLKAFFVTVDGDQETDRAVAFFERHLDRFVKVSVTAEG